MQVKPTFTGLGIAVIAILSLHVAVLAEFSCYQCKSDNPKCLSDFDNLKKVCEEAENVEVVGCLTKFDPTDGSIERACAFNTTECDENCFKCPEEDCNSNIVCKICNSTNDSDCAQTDATKPAFSGLCEATAKNCVINVGADKHLVRRCSNADDEKNCNNASCKMCLGANCNTGIFPEDRRRCYQCKLNDTNCRTSESITPLPCLLYNQDDKCYTYGANETSMQRGCLSDEDKNCGSGECSTCDLDNCNNKSFKTSSGLKCIKCQTTAENDDCSWGQDAATAQDCPDILYNETAQCYIQNNEGAVQRGCVNERDDNLGDCNDAENCVTCGTNGCNGKDENSFTCIRCRSDIDPLCRNDPEKLTGTSCRNPVIASNNKCYMGIWNNVVIRSCVADADEATLWTCSQPNNNNRCQICTGNNCNTMKSGAEKAHGLFAPLILSIMMAILTFTCYH